MAPDLTLVSFPPIAPPTAQREASPSSVSSALRQSFEMRTNLSPAPKVQTALSPEQAFEAFFLQLFVEAVLPADTESFFGKGTSGAVWKSMMAEHMATEMARQGGFGIADMMTPPSSSTGAAMEEGR